MKWFKHNTNAHTDTRLQKIRMKFGADGYALYWLCVEIIAGEVSQDNITFELEHDADLLGKMLNIGVDRVKEIMEYMIQIDLFSLNTKNHRLICMALANCLDDTLSRNQRMKQVLHSAKLKGIVKGKKEYVYLMKDRYRYKIGRTNNLEKRLRDFRVSNTNITLEHFIETPNSGALETELHERYKDRRIEGEWFKLDFEDVDEIFVIKPKNAPTT